MAVKWPEGVKSAAGSCGIKDGDLLDLGVIVTDETSAWAGTFTHNAAAAAAVHWCRRLMGREVRAIVVNSGNANACTGPEGVRAVERTARKTAALVGCHPQQVLVASTGTIGIPLPIDSIEASLPAVVAGIGEDADAFARSILTTDTRTKMSSVTAGDASFVGVAKGAAMLAPNMATMLAFLVTDADVDRKTFQRALHGAVDRSFNRISVDACESTNDSVIAIATGRGPRLGAEELEAGLAQLCRPLAHEMVRDAEGGSKVVRIQIAGALDEARAADLGRAVAASALWRAAVHGADPNWGRIAAALGQSDRDLDLLQLEVTIGSETVFERGRPAGSLDAAKKAMQSEEFDVVCRVGSGPGSAEVLTCDLSTQYVVENAFGTT